MTNELAGRVRAAATGYEFPPAPPLADQVVARLVDARPARPHRRVASVACAAALASAAVLASSERARSAVVDVLDLVPGVEIRSGEALPRATSLLVQTRDFGRRVPLEAAQRQAGLRLRLPRELPAPAAVFLDRSVGGAAVTAVWGSSAERASLIVTQWHPARLLFRKLLTSPDTRVEVVEVDGTRGLWISGDDHELFYVGMDGRSRRAPPVLVGRVLTWERGGVVYRIEGDVSLERALRFSQLRDL